MHLITPPLPSARPVTTRCRRISEPPHNMKAVREPTEQLIVPCAGTVATGSHHVPFIVAFIVAVVLSFFAT